EDDPSHHERKADDHHRESEVVRPLPWPMKQIPEARTVIRASPATGACTAERIAIGVRREDDHQYTGDRQRRSDQPSPHAVTSWSGSTWAERGTRALPTDRLAGRAGHSRPWECLCV